LKHTTDLHSLLVVIGPEGGFSENEIQKAKETGFFPVSFGLRRLRTETAAVIAAIQSQRS
jgi:16S rRNA (uracil1498-N3)-methyltransferase